MEILVLLAHLVLAGVFLVSGIAKLADQPGSRKALTDFGVPERFTTPLGLALPIGELVVAAALLFPLTAWWGSLGALGLLAVFCAAIGYNMALGRKPDCHCFGQLQSEPIGWPTLARNGLLAAVAVFALAASYGTPSLSLVGLIDRIPISSGVAVLAWLATLALIGVMGWGLVNVISQNGRLMDRMEQLEALVANLPAQGQGMPAARPAPAGLPAGSPAPDFKLPNLEGGNTDLRDIRKAEKPVLLTFVDPNCGPCTALLPDLARWQREHAEKFTVAVVSRGSLKDNQAKNKKHNIRHWVIQQDREVADVYKVSGTPGAVMILPGDLERNGVVASRAVMGADQIRALASEVIAGGVPNPAPAQQPAPPAALPIGAAAPEVKLPDLNGKTVDLRSYKGSDVLLVFWNPDCGFCQRLLADLRAWEGNQHATAPQLLLVSTADTEKNRAMNLRSSVVQDPGFATARAFGVSGTPCAVLVDAQGKIASEVAIGADAVLTLAKRERAAALA